MVAPLASDVYHDLVCVLGAKLRPFAAVHALAPQLVAPLVAALVGADSYHHPLNKSLLQSMLVPELRRLLLSTSKQKHLLQQFSVFPTCRHWVSARRPERALDSRAKQTKASDLRKL